MVGISADKIGPQMGSYAPNFTLKDLNGKTVSLTDYRGKVVFLNLWATWCPPCREEMPSMQKLYDQLQGQEFEILAVSIDSDGARSVGPFMNKYGLTFPALLDTDNRVARLYRVTGVPESFIIDKKGVIKKKIIGPMDWSSESARSFFYSLLKETP
ncbi:MAG: TlpA family protein disulfide reductase [Candidatus Tectomicrobia bacterium]|uniref:TlpA family protein disulfide reductase n=1 Tax=Tectimicrobiota bacterium TaxID=2528274 RepID=A0A933GNE7_UNCTE|nr:TlpA family protein disulfide reductase [Candidatus Tectomicrobia bacterium]